MFYDRYLSNVVNLWNIVCISLWSRCTRVSVNVCVYMCACTRALKHSNYCKSETTEAAEPSRLFSISTLFFFFLFLFFFFNMPTLALYVVYFKVPFGDPLISLFFFFFFSLYISNFAFYCLCQFFPPWQHIFLFSFFLLFKFFLLGFSPTHFFLHLFHFYFHSNQKKKKAINLFKKFHNRWPVSTLYRYSEIFFTNSNLNFLRLIMNKQWFFITF